jgi:hypothetical protein
MKKLLFVLSMFLAAAEAHASGQFYLDTGPWSSYSVKGLLSASVANIAKPQHKFALLVAHRFVDDIKIERTGTVGPNGGWIFEVKIMRRGEPAKIRSYEVMPRFYLNIGDEAVAKLAEDDVRNALISATSMSVYTQAQGVCGGNGPGYLANVTVDGGLGKEGYFKTAEKVYGIDDSDLFSPDPKLGEGCP